MTAQEKKRSSAVLRATEYLFLENIALKLVPEHRKLGNWYKLLDRLLADEEMLAGVRLKFRDIYAERDGAADCSEFLEAFWSGFPVSKKKHGSYEGVFAVPTSIANISKSCAISLPGSDARLRTQQNQCGTARLVRELTCADLPDA